MLIELAPLWLLLIAAALAVVAAYYSPTYKKWLYRGIFSTGELERMLQGGDPNSKMLDNREIMSIWAYMQRSARLNELLTGRILKPTVFEGMCMLRPASIICPGGNTYDNMQWATGCAAGVTLSAVLPCSKCSFTWPAGNSTSLLRSCLSHPPAAPSVATTIISDKAFMPGGSGFYRAVDRAFDLAAALNGTNLALQTMDGLRTTAVKESNAKDCEALREVWTTLYPRGDEPPPLVTPDKPDPLRGHEGQEGWAELGFQRKCSPSTDFRDMGALALRQFAHFCEVRRDQALKVVSQTSLPYKGVPLALVSIAMTRWVRDLAQDRKLLVFFAPAGRMWRSPSDGSRAKAAAEGAKKLALIAADLVHAALMSAFLDDWFAAPPANVLAFEARFKQWKGPIEAQLMSSPAGTPAMLQDAASSLQRSVQEVAHDVMGQLGKMDEARARGEGPSEVPDGHPAVSGGSCPFSSGGVPAPTTSACPFG